MSIATGVKLTKLANGLSVLTKEIHTSPVVTVWAWYKVGSRNEREGITGCSHWVEHMLFKGGIRFKKGDIFKQVARVGGYNNGFTSQDYTIYFESLPADKVELGLDIEADRMANAAFDPAETESERTVIISEREGAENNPEYLLSEEVMGTAFRHHPYRWPIVGYMNDLQTMTRDELYDYYRTYYGPNNAMLLVVGDFETTALLKKIEKYFGSINSQVAPPPLKSIEPPQQAERRVCLRRPGTAAYLQMGYHIPSPSQEDFVALIMLDAVLSGAKSFGFSGGAWMGRSSRLYRALVDANLASAVGSSLPFSQDPSLFSFWATARTGIEPQQVEEALLNELHRIADAPPTTPELEKALRQTRAQLAYGLDGVTGQAFALGYFTSIASYDYLDTLVENLSKVKPADVQQIAAKYLKTENQTLGWFLPTEEPAGEEEKGAPPKVFHFSSKQSKAGSEAKTALPVERFPLSFGGVLLVCPNPNVPIAGIRGSLSAGGIRESDEVAGLAGFTSRLVMRGTEKRTYQQVAEEVESLGASLSFGASFEEAYCSAKCLSGDVAHLLEVISDCWRNPIFPSNEIDKVRSEMLTGIREQMDDTRTVAEQTFRRLLYPAGHPYGRTGTGSEETIAVISREQLAGFHKSYFRPQDLILVMVGDVEPFAARDAVEEAFAGWQKGNPAQPILPDIAPRQKALTEVKSMMHKSQADLVLGFPALKRTDKDYYAADMANLIVGRLGLYGRLGKKVRDEQGLAYYSFSRLQAWRHAGHWVVQAGVNPKNVAKAHDSILLELKRLTSEPVAEEELADAKSNQIGSLALRLETNDGIAGAILEMEYYQLGLDYLQRFPGIIRSLTKEQLMEAAKRYLATEAFLEVIAGPYKKS